MAESKLTEKEIVTIARERILQDYTEDSWIIAKGQTFKTKREDSQRMYRNVQFKLTSRKRSDLKKTIVVRVYEDGKGPTTDIREAGFTTIQRKRKPGRHGRTRKQRRRFED